LQETKNAIHYVLFNEQKHTGKKVATLDAYSSLHSLDAKKIAKKVKLTLQVGREQINFFIKDHEKSFLGKKSFYLLVC
jgi:hypothetical protein